MMRPGLLNSGILGLSPFGSAVSKRGLTPPAAPTGLAATVVSATQINLAWTESAGATGYKIERGTDGVVFALIDTVGAVVVYEDTGLAAGTYYYRIAATNAAGDSDYSDVASATITWIDIAAPTWYIEADQGDLLQAPAGAAVTADGDPVGYAPHHLSGGDFRQATAGRFPTYKTGILNGHPVLRFDGGDYLIDSTTLHLITDTSGLFVIVGARGNTGALQTYVASADTLDGGRFVILRSWSTTNRLGVSQQNGPTDTATDPTGGTSTDTNYHLYEFESSGTAYTIRIDGVAETLTGTNNGDWLGDTDDRDNVTIGALKYTALAQYLTGDLAVVAYYSNPADFTADARSALQSKYALPFDFAPADGGGGEPPTLATMEVDEFMIAIIPDTQWYPWLGTPEFNDMTEWIAAHAADADKNIQMVIHNGDVIWSSQGDRATQFARADAAMDNLDAANINYLLTMGNHDYDTDIPPPANRSHTLFNGTFPQSRFTSQAGWVGGFYQATFDGNAYWSRTIGGNDYLFMVISFGPTQDVIDWAAGVIDAHPNHDVWIITHAYMYRDGTRLGTGDQWNPHTIFPAETDTNDGEEMWTKLVKLKANIVWVQNGHDGMTTAPSWVQARRQDNGDSGNLVNQVVANYHTTAHGGLGYMRLVAVRPAANVVDVYTYSPNQDVWFRDDANEFTVAYKNV